VSDDKVVRLIDRAPGIASANREELFAWLDGWLEQIEEEGNARSLILIVETTDGNVYHLGQTTHPVAGAARVLGLMQILGHKILHGTGHHPTIEEAKQ
jgi:hypothetical protein